MYDNLNHFLDSGGSLIYLGGNGIYEVGTYYNDQADCEDYPAMMFFGGNDNESNANRQSYLFGNPLASGTRPNPVSILGVATMTETPVQGSPYYVLQDYVLQGHSWFNGTGLYVGAPFGGSGLNKGGSNTTGAASAWEIDDTWGHGPLPVGTQVLANAGSLPHGLPGWRTSPGTGADMTIYQHPIGKGWVFSAGSITFGGSLVVDKNIKIILANVLKL
jgi:hypothetical protein